MPMSCGLDVDCHAARVVSDQLTKTAQAAGEWCGDLLVSWTTWWVRTSTPNPDSELVHHLQAYTLPVVLLVMMCGILAQSIRMVITRKFTPLVNVGTGLVRYVTTTTIGLMALGVAVAGADALAEWLLDSTAEQFAAAMKNVFVLQTEAGPIVNGQQTATQNALGLLVMSCIGGLLAACQWMIGLFRQAGLLVLAVLMPLAAAGTLSHAGREWLDKMLPWLVTLVFYKPMAALIYKIGFAFFGQAHDLTTAMIGFMTLVLAMAALPVMLKFFSWSGANVGGGGGGGMAAAIGTFAGSRGGAAASGAAEQSNSVSSSNRMQHSGPDSGAAPQGAAPSAPPPRQGQAESPPSQAGDPSPGTSGGGTGQAAAAGTVAGGPVGAAGAALSKQAMEQAKQQVNEGSGNDDDQQR